MKIVIITCVFEPEPVVSARIAKDLASELAESGHRVLVVCPFPSRPKGKIFDGYSRRGWDNVFSDTGFSVLRVLTFVSKSSSFVSRFFENISFGLSSSIYLLFVRDKPDVIFLNTWPVFAVFMNTLVARLRGIRVLRSIQDIYPETLSSQKRVSKKGFLYWLIGIFERYNYKKANANITISEKMGAVLSDRYPDLESALIVPNWHSLPTQSKKEFDRSQIESSLTSDDFVFLYGGNISTASNIVGLLTEFSVFSADKENVKLVIAGSGPLLAQCTSLVKELKLQGRVYFHSPWLSQDTLPILECADILVLPTDNEQAIYSVPSKIISYMTSARPILAYGAPGSELESLIVRSGCGWFIDGVGNESIQVGFRGAFDSSPQGRLKMGLQGQKFMTENLSKEVNIPKIVNLLLDIPEGSDYV